MRTIEQYKGMLQARPQAEVTNLYELYSDLESWGPNDRIILELITQELVRRGILKEPK